MAQERKKNTRTTVLLIVGLLLIAAVSLLEGPVPAAQNAIQHVVEDVTTELVVHVYIAGLAIIIIGAWLLMRSKH